MSVLGRKLYSRSLFFKEVSLIMLVGVVTILNGAIMSKLKHLTIFKGKERSIRSIALEYNMNPDTLYARYHKGLKDDELVAPANVYRLNSDKLKEECERRNFPLEIAIKRIREGFRGDRIFEEDESYLERYKEKEKELSALLYLLDSISEVDVISRGLNLPKNVVEDVWLNNRLKVKTFDASLLKKVRDKWTPTFGSEFVLTEVKRVLDDNVRRGKKQ